MDVKTAEGRRWSRVLRTTQYCTARDIVLVPKDVVRLILVTFPKFGAAKREQELRSMYFNPQSLTTFSVERSLQNIFSPHYQVALLLGGDGQRLLLYAERLPTRSSVAANVLDDEDLFLSGQ